MRSLVAQLQLFFLLRSNLPILMVHIYKWPVSNCNENASVLRNAHGYDFARGVALLYCYFAALPVF